MIELTSLADLRFRITKDERYKQVAVNAYRNYRYRDIDYNGNFDTAMEWVESWTKNRIDLGATSTCDDMMDYLNRIVKTTGLDKILDTNPTNDNPTSNVGS